MPHLLHIHSLCACRYIVKNGQWIVKQCSQTHSLIETKEYVLIWFYCSLCVHIFIFAYITDLLQFVDIVITIHWRLSLPNSLSTNNLTLWIVIWKSFTDITFLWPKFNDFLNRFLHVIEKHCKELVDLFKYDTFMYGLFVHSCGVFK